MIRFDHGEKSYGVYHTEKGYFATDGYCTHEQQHLEQGFYLAYRQREPDALRYADELSRRAIRSFGI